MTDDSPSALGPLFGPDFILVTVDDANKVSYQLEIFPDGNNPLLKSNGIAQQFYFMPQRIYLAKKQDSPQDFDFGMTVFKGLMTSEDTVGVTPGQGTGGGDVEVGGGFCTFSTTFAIPPEVITNAIAALKSQSFTAPPPPRLLPYMNFSPTDPAPLLGIVPILSNSVSIAIPQFAPGGPTTPTGGTPTPTPPPSGSPAPTPPPAGSTPPLLWAQAQCAQKGSIEAEGISSFLVSCSELAAGAIAGSLQAGVSPFTVYYALSEQFYLPACFISVTIDMDKTFDSFSANVSAGNAFISGNFQEAYSNCVTNGSIVTDMKINEAAIPDDLKQMILQQCQQMQQNAINWVKDEIFDWQPTDGGAAQAPPQSLLGSIFGGASVSMKSTYQHRGLNVTQQLTLDTTIAKDDTLSGDLSDLEPAIKADIGKYLAIVDIGQYFQKVQVAATNAINWNETLPDGTNLADPIMSAMVEVSYPVYSQPLGAQNTVNLQTLGQGFHYLVGQQAGTTGLAQWTSNNPVDVINIAFLRLDKPITQWPQDQVQVTKTLIFDGNDPRVDLTGNKTQVVITTTDNDHTPVIDMDAVGYVFVRFMCRPLPPNVTIVINTTLGPRKDNITITSANQKSAIWEIFSDKYIALTSFQYTVQVTVQGPNFTDNPIVYQSAAPVTAALPPGRVKYQALLSLQLPNAPANLVQAINTYILQYQQQMATGTLT